VATVLVIMLHSKVGTKCESVKKSLNVDEEQISCITDSFKFTTLGEAMQNYRDNGFLKGLPTRRETVCFLPSELGRTFDEFKGVFIQTNESPSVSVQSEFIFDE